MKHIAFASGGKDSTAMIELMFRSNIRIDEIVFVANEKEFPQEKKFRDFLIDSWSYKARCVVLKAKTTWNEWFYGDITRGPKKGLMRGFPPTLYPCYWTRESKVKIIERYIKKQKEDVIQFIGYTADEKSKVRQDIHYKYYGGIKGKKFPLIDWVMTEKDCRDYCYENGTLNPLYNHFDRLGCYLCPKQNRKSLKTLKENFPEQWEELISYCKDTCAPKFVSPGQFNINFSLEDLYNL